MNRNEQEDFYDLVYDAWRNGKDPDAVNMDAFDDYLGKGYPSDEITVDMVYPEVPKKPIVNPLIEE